MSITAETEENILCFCAKITRMATFGFSVPDTIESVNITLS